MMSRLWNFLLGFLFFFVILYILLLNGFDSVISAIIVKNYLMKMDENFTKFRLPKPVYFSIELNTMKRLNNRPRNTTDYEKGHKDLCKNSWQVDYTKLHKHLIEKTQNKFMIFLCPSSGWGNRIRDLITSFHFAVVAKRSFIIRCDAPSPLDKYLEPRNIKWNYKVNETYLTVRRGHKVILNDIKDPTDPKVFEKMLNYSVEYSPALLGNKYQFLAENVKYDLPVWPNLPQMNGCTFYYLFKKSDMLQKHLDEWKEKLGFNENIVMGIHIRQGDSVWHHNRGDKRLDYKDADFTFDCAIQIQMKIEEKYNTTKVIWFLASDSEKMKNYAKQKHGDKVRCINGPIEHVGHPSRGNEDAGHLSMFLDYFLLQDADYRLYTGPSTFDDAINFITLGTQNFGRSWYMRKRYCLVPQSLRS